MVSQAVQSVQLRELTRKSWWRRTKQQTDDEAAGPESQTGSSALTSLPLELQLQILSYLDLQSVVCLRQTCPLYRRMITVDVVTKRFIKNGQQNAALRACCYECLAMPGLERLILDKTRSGHMWRSLCFRCWRFKLTSSYQRKYGPVLEFASNDYGYVCQFCAWPVCRADPDSRLKALHSRCRIKRLMIVLLWLLLTFFQVGLGILAATLAWTAYKRVLQVLVPSTIDFVLSIFAVSLLTYRSFQQDQQKYTYALATELLMTLARIPPVMFTARVSANPTSRRYATLITFSSGVFILNLVLRLLDTMGYALLYFGYDPRNMFLVGLPRRKKALNILCTLLVWYACVPN